jgi:hypothetical protein
MTPVLWWTFLRRAIVEIALSGTGKVAEGEYVADVWRNSYSASCHNSRKCLLYLAATPIQKSELMRHSSIIVRAAWDGEAGVWVATSSDIDGLVVEAATIEALEPKVLAVLSDLIELNGIESELPEIPVHIMTEQLVRIPNPSY